MTTLDITVYIVRHGENPANINREFSYRLVDYSLTPKGVRQAEDTARFFRDKQIDAIYSSPLKRAAETAEIIAAPLRLPVTLIEEFREINVGTLEGEPPTDENWALHDSIIADWREGRHDSTFPGGEDFHILRSRIGAGLRLALADHAASETRRRIVIVAHGGILTGTVRGLCQDPDLELLNERPCHNCSVSEFTVRLHEDEGGEPIVRMHSWAAADHLSHDLMLPTKGTR